MKNETVMAIQPVEEMPGNMVPFVNDECGDSMWDNVLKEAEEQKDKPGAGLDLTFRY